MLPMAMLHHITSILAPPNILLWLILVMLTVLWLPRPRSSIITIAPIPTPPLELLTLLLISVLATLPGRFQQHKTLLTFPSTGFSPGNSSPPSLHSPLPPKKPPPAPSPTGSLTRVQAKPPKMPRQTTMMASLVLPP